MLVNEYVKTKTIGKYVVNIGDDDNGQQFFAEWIDSDGNANEQCLGAYNFGWEEDLVYLFQKDKMCGGEPYCQSCDYNVECKRIRGI